MERDLKVCSLQLDKLILLQNVFILIPVGTNFIGNSIVS
jgi:hypothetical protein